MTIESILSECESKMKSAIEALLHDFQTIRTGRANSMVLERVKVDYYGVETPVTQVANITVPESRQLMITPYEKNMLGPIERAIQKSDLGINPSNDGQNIRLNFPQMTEERRRELVKQVNARGEQGCVAVRNVRHHAIEHLKALQKDKLISEDDVKINETKVQKLTDKYIAEIHEHQRKKDTELMEV